MARRRGGAGGAAAAARSQRWRWGVVGIVVVTMGYWLWAHRAPVGTDADANADANANASASASANANANADADADAKGDADAGGVRGARDGGTARIDAAKREELRRQIFEGMWRNAEPETVAPAGGFTAPPAKAQELSSDYIHGVLDDDFRPLARACYNEFAARQPDAGGQLLVRFVIVGDEKVGGIVESAELDPKSTLKDPKLETCIRESMMTMEFAPPQKGGSVTIIAPITFVAK